MLNPMEQFAPLLDPDGMALVFQRYLSGSAHSDWSVTSCRIQHPRYKTYRSRANKARSTLSLVYHLQGHSYDSNIQESHIYYARAYLGNRSEDVYQAAIASMGAGAEINVVHIASLGMVGWRFPFDPAMPQLAELMDPKRVAELHAPSRLRVNSERVEIDIVNYRPEIRCTARYRFLDTNAKQRFACYGKVFADHQGRNIRRHMRQLRLQAGPGSDHFEIPKILAYDHDRHTLWLQALDGMPFRRALTADTADRLLMRLARGITAFHRFEIQALPRIDLNDLYLEWRKKAEKLRDAAPQTSGVLQMLLSHLMLTFPDSVEFALIHGDFHADQLAVLPSGRLALFDFDELAIADPLIDVANFCADLCSQTAEAADNARWLGSLFNAYAQAAEKPVCLKRFCWHLRGQFLTRAYRAHIQQVSQADQKIHSLLALAQIPWEHTLHRYCET
jgi:aminoglycoside phosphotransferase